MKPFNLDEYLANPTKRLITRDGRKVNRILCTDVNGRYPIVAVIESHDGNTEQAYSFTKDGKYYVNDFNEKDLFFASEKHEGWMNIYKFSRECSAYKGSFIWPTEEEAKSAADSDPVATVKIEWEE